MKKSKSQNEYVDEEHPEFKLVFTTTDNEIESIEIQGFRDGWFEKVKGGFKLSAAMLNFMKMTK